MKKIVEIKNLIKRYGSVTAVSDVTFNINEGKFFSLLGPSGCGKTTILRIIGGFINQDSGSVFINGLNMDGVPPNKRNTSMVFQNLALFPHMSVAENIIYGLKKRHMPAGIIKDRLGNMLSVVNLSGYEKRRINELSGGQQQRVALARSLIIEPEILLLDEPLASLDKKLRVLMRSELKEIQKRTGTTFLYVTHDQSEALTMSDSIAVMNEGKIIQCGSPGDIYSKPVNRFAADFIGAGNFIKVKNASNEGNSYLIYVENGGKIILRQENYEFAAGGSNTTFFIRPEKIKVSHSSKYRDTNTIEPINQFTGKVTSVVFEGPDIRIKIFSAPLGNITAEIKNDDLVTRFAENDDVTIYWNTAEGMVLHDRDI
jgi:ABC-type Fe3+/spermidine/putrescine transport system ATPase subunit